LDELGVIGGDTAGDVGDGKVGRDSMEEELAEAFPNFDPLALPVIGQSIGNDRRVVFVYDVVLHITRGKNDRAANGNPCTDKRW
jgi:hypothetical protein